MGPMPFRYPKFSFNPTSHLEPLTPLDMFGGEGRARKRADAYNPSEAPDWKREVLRAKEAPLKTEPKFSARLFVGFNVGGTPTWTLKDVKAQAFFLREEMGADPDLSIWAGEGIFRGEKKLVSEKSAQIVILDFGTDWEKFVEPMVPFTGYLARRLLQESIALQLNDKGVSHFSELIPSGLSEDERNPALNAVRIREAKAETLKFLKRFED